MECLLGSTRLAPDSKLLVSLEALGKEIVLPLADLGAT